MNRDGETTHDECPMAVACKLARAWAELQERRRLRATLRALKALGAIRPTLRNRVVQCFEAGEPVTVRELMRRLGLERRQFKTLQMTIYRLTEEQVLKRVGYGQYERRTNQN